MQCSNECCNEVCNKNQGIEMSIKSSISQRCKIATDCLPASPLKTKLEALHIEMLRFIKAKAPAWHDKPTAPGVWVVGSRCLHINELDLPIYERSNCRWYGPIPDDGGKP